MKRVGCQPFLCARCYLFLLFVVDVAVVVVVVVGLCGDVERASGGEIVKRGYLGWWWW